MTAAQLCGVGGWLQGVKEPDSRINSHWLAHAPKGFRFTNGIHTVRKEMDETWEARLGYLGLERCGPGCSCRGRDR